MTDVFDYPGNDGFLGLRNKGKDAARPLGSMDPADDVYIDDQAVIRARPGYWIANTITNATSFFQRSRLDPAYIISAGVLYRLTEGGQIQVVQTSVGTDFKSWTASGDRAYYVGAEGSGCVFSSGVLQPYGVPTPLPPTVYYGSGRLLSGVYLVAVVLEHEETGLLGAASELVAVTVGEAEGAIHISPAGPPAGYRARVYMSMLDGETLYFVGYGDQFVEEYDNPVAIPLDEERIACTGVPENVVAVGLLNGLMFAGVYSETADKSFIYRSVPHAPHLFRSGVDVLTVPGEIRMICPVQAEQAVYFGTNRAIHYHSPSDGGMRQVAPYGVPRGHQYAVTTDERTLMWTNKGVCRAPDFSNITDAVVEVETKEYCRVMVVDIDDVEQLMVFQHG